MPASRLNPLSFFLTLYCRRKYKSLNLQGASPNPVTQNKALSICESISIHFRLGELMSSQAGWHMAGAEGVFLVSWNALEIF